MNTTIDLYSAIRQMDELTRSGQTFSFKFRKYDRSRSTGGQLVEVPEAKLRPKAADESVAYSSYKLYFVDTSTGAARVCWQPLIVEFNGMRVTLK